MTFDPTFTRDKAKLCDRPIIKNERFHLDSIVGVVLGSLGKGPTLGLVN